MPKLKRGPRLLILAVIVGAPIGYYYHGVHNGSIKPVVFKTLIPIKADNITASVIAGTGNVKQAPLPSSSVLGACVDGNTSNCLPGPTPHIKVWAWNANMGLLLANGGIQTTKGSLMAKYGVPVVIERQDDTNIMKAELLSFVQQLAGNPNSSGTNLITIMGDGAAQFMHDLNPKLAQICSDCTAEIVATIGYSRGEDGFWGLPEWKTDPQKMRGALIAGVERDGDWNIQIKYDGQNAVPNNPDDQTYDPNAVNWVNADDFIKAAEMYVSNYCEELPVKGNLGGQKKKVCVNGVVTWTPGDVNLAKKRGGLVPVMTTRESAFQMPCVLIGIKRWDRAHKDQLTKIIAASYEAADQIRAFPSALQKAGEVSASVYKEENAAYWVKYYRGTSEADATGVTVPLGGSYVANLADGIQSFGLNGGANLLAATYSTFGKIVVQQYPKLYPDFPSINQVLDTGYVAAVRSMNTLPTNNGESQAYTKSTAPMASVEGKRNYSIQFATGSAIILPSSFAELNQLADDVIITKYIVALHGHTDMTGSPEGNIDLSQRRAASVKDYLTGHGVRNVIRVYAHGSEDPIADNSTAAGRALNRRVQIVLGTVAN